MTPVRSAFARLHDLLDGIPTPKGLDPIQLHLGESQLETPAIDFTPLADEQGWTRYPRLGGTPELRAAYGHWLQRRFGVRQSLLDRCIAIEPTPGTKQAVAVAIALAVARSRGFGDPAVIMPNPFYPTYRAGAEEAGAQPVFYTVDDGDSAAPIAAAVEAAGGRAVAITVCNPGNPRGEILPADHLREVAKIAVAAQAVLLVDECYTDLSLGQPPPGYLSLVKEGTVEPGEYLVFHSLSKRSGTPGLRSGFVAGAPSTVAAYAGYNRACGVSTPLPVSAVAAALWADDTHVARARASLVKNWELADELLGGVPHYLKAKAGFFLWLPVTDDEETARRLWRDHALSVMPGRYLAAEGADGVNPGVDHLRIALVHDKALMREALTRLRDALLTDASAPATSRQGEETMAMTRSQRQLPAELLTSPVLIAQQLIRFNTVNPPGDEAACVGWIRDLLDGAGIETRILAADSRRPNLIARLPGRGLEPPLLLHAHVDVVPVAGQSWSQPPFSAKIVDGELWGRGAIDMKGQLAMMLAALLRMRVRSEAPAGDVILAVVPDEEAGSTMGARFLVERYPELFDGVRYAIGEDGGAELGLGRYARLHSIVVAEKRTCWLRATLRGPGGHASRLGGADGAVPKLNRLLTAISDGGLGIRLTPVVDRMLYELANALPPSIGARVAAFRSDPADPSVLDGLGETTVTYLRSIVQHTVSATVVHGGTGTNVHPSEITIELDGRILPGEFSTEEFLALLHACIGVDLNLELLVEGELVPPPRLDGFYDRLVSVLKDKDPGGVPLPMMTTASTDARLFSQLGIQCFGWMPLLHGPDAIYRDRLHCADERVAVSALEFGTDCFSAMLSGRPA